jgi:methylthioribose-1-phosphate isomerase
MRIDGQPYRTIWPVEGAVRIIDQRHLPFQFVLEDLRSVRETAVAIREMHVRGAGLIGVTAAWSMWFAARESGGDEDRLRELAAELVETRPTAVNLRWAVERQLRAILMAADPVATAYETAQEVTEEDAECCRRIGEHGLPLIAELASQKPTGNPVQILTHCNAGWLAFVDYGSATAPIYAAHDSGIPVHVWVDETRPRNQGARLTAWELRQHGVPHTVIPDNAGGHLMQHGLVDLVLTGTDRTTRTGDVANKIGTYLKALAAQANGVPFHVALPSSTFDWELRDGVREIPIEQRSGDEVRWIDGATVDGTIVPVRLIEDASPVANYAFDVTPRHLISGLVTERGRCAATEEDILRLADYFSQQKSPLAIIHR